MRLAPERPPRRLSLTPMIDVVFLLLVFFMLAARFGQDGAIEVTLSGSAQTYQGPPRLVDIGPDEVRLNGVSVAEGQLAAQLLTLVTTPEDTIVLRPREGANVQRIVDVMGTLRDAGLDGLAIVE